MNINLYNISMSPTYNSFSHHRGGRRIWSHTVIRHEDWNSDLVHWILQDPKSPFNLLRNRMSRAIDNSDTRLMWQMLKEWFENQILCKDTFFWAITCQEYCENSWYTRDNIHTVEDEELWRIFMSHFKVRHKPSKIVFIKIQ